MEALKARFELARHHKRSRPWNRTVCRRVRLGPRPSPLPQWQTPQPTRTPHGPGHLMNLRKSLTSVARSKPSSVSSASSQPACGPEKRVMLCNYAHLQACQSSSMLRMPPIQQTFLVHNMFVDRGSMTRAVDNDNFILFDNSLRKQFI
jgi:hypothetical protein